MSPFIPHVVMLIQFEGVRSHSYYKLFKSLVDKKEFQLQENCLKWEIQRIQKAEPLNKSICEIIEIRFDLSVSTKYFLSDTLNYAYSSDTCMILLISSPTNTDRSILICIS